MRVATFILSLFGLVGTLATFAVSARHARQDHGCHCAPAGGCQCGPKCGCKADSGKCDRAVGEKRLEALLDLCSAYSELTAVYFAHAGQAGEFPPQVADRYLAALITARGVVNRTAILFDLDFNKDADRYFEVHRQMSHLPGPQWGKYRLYLAELSNEFDALCKATLEGRPAPRMSLADIPYERRIAMTPEGYLDAHLRHWQEGKDAKAREALRLPPLMPRADEEGVCVFCVTTPAGERPRE